MNAPASCSFTQWYCEGEQASFLRTRKSPGGILELLDIEGHAGDVSRPAFDDIVLYQELRGGCHLNGDLGGGRFNITAQKGQIIVAAPNFATTTVVDVDHRVRSMAFPVAHWQTAMDEASDGRFSFDRSSVYGRMMDTPAIRSALRSLWGLCVDEGAPSRLLARAAGFEILAELCRLGGTPLTSIKGGLAPWAKRRCLELMNARLSEDISLDELAAEAQLSPYHFARMFKQSLGVPPRVYLTRLRVEKACELLEKTSLPITEIAFEVGYSSNQVLARVFLKHRHMSPSNYRRAVRDPVSQISMQTREGTLAGLGVNR